MSLEVAILRLYKGWLPDAWTYSFDGKVYKVQETFTDVPTHELKRLEDSAINSGFKILSQTPSVCVKKASREEATMRQLEEFAIQAGGLNLISYNTQGIILDELLDSITKK